jgi:hypothetical protein
VWVAAFNYITTFPIYEHLLELVKNTTARFEVTKVITQETRTKASIKAWFGAHKYSGRTFAR